MTAILEKSQVTNIFRDSKNNDTSYTLGVNWGEIEIQKRNFLGIKTKKITLDIDLDLTCIMFDAQKKAIDWIYSPKYNSWLIHHNFPLGKYHSKDNAFNHFYKTLNDESQYKKTIKINPNKIDNEIETVFFYLSIDRKKIKETDFSMVESVNLRINEDVKVDKPLIEFNIKSNYNKKNKGILVLGKLFREGNEWKFKAMGQAIDEQKFITLTRGF